MGRLNSEAIDDPAAIRRILRSAWLASASLIGGVTRRRTAKSALIEKIGSDGTVCVLLKGHGCEGREPVFFRCMLDGRPHFFSTRAAGLDDDHLAFGTPRVIYVGERRDRLRSRAPTKYRVALLADDRKVTTGLVVDRSPGGLGLEVPARAKLASEMSIGIRFLSERDRRDEVGEIRNLGEASAVGWKRVGVLLLPGMLRGRISSEWRESNTDVDRPRTGRTVPLARGSRQSWDSPGLVPPTTAINVVKVPVVAFENERHERIAAILDICGDPSKGPAVIIPPAWGKTKETLLSLSAVIQAAFVASGESVSVLRFDGVRRRGESHNDADCEQPGMENLHFTFSQAVTDLRAAVDYVRQRLQPSAVIIVTFSASAIEGRRVVADDGGMAVNGWISVVGAPDPQSLIRGLSGGVDYFAGYEQGKRFGQQEIQGLLLDIDAAARDAIDNRLAFLDDARADLARIKIPITWIHGEHDAWLDVERVRDILSVGDTQGRRLVLTSTGHQLRNSREALEVFQLIASEVGRIGIKRTLENAPIDPRALSRRRKAEKDRLKQHRGDMRRFWQAYLLGRDGDVGVELVASTESYRGLMRDQVEALGLEPGQRVVDFGSGVGTFARYLREVGVPPCDLQVVELDYVQEALRYAKQRLTNGNADREPKVRFLVADLDGTRNGRTIPLASDVADRALASLVLNYLEDPSHLLSEIWRILRPNGILVLSTLKQDADTSRICVRGVGELRAGASHRVFDEGRQHQLDHSLRYFISDAGRLIDLEEQGVFRFWSEEDLIQKLERLGFRVTRSTRSFGEPPQALLITAMKR